MPNVLRPYVHHRAFNPDVPRSHQRVLNACLGGFLLYALGVGAGLIYEAAHASKKDGSVASGVAASLQKEAPKVRGTGVSGVVEDAGEARAQTREGGRELWSLSFPGGD